MMPSSQPNCCEICLRASTSTRMRSPPVSFPGKRPIVQWALRRGRAAIFADTGLGKAQPVDEPVATPNGWKAIGDLHIGDEVMSDDGKPTSVLGVFPQGKRPIYRVTMNDGSWTDCDPEHLWVVATDLQLSRGQGWQCLSLADIVRARTTPNSRTSPLAHPSDAANRVSTPQSPHRPLCSWRLVSRWMFNPSNYHLYSRG